MAIPRIGQKAPDAAGFIVLAGLARSLGSTYLEQYTYIYSLDGSISSDEQNQLETLKTQIAKVEDPNLSPSTPTSDLLDIPAVYWLDLRGYKPAEQAKLLKQPMLIMQGEADYQVTMVDSQLWKDALAGKSNVQFKSYKGLYHLFMTAHQEKARPSDYDVPGHVDPTTIADSASWIK